jgi:hypothetical protein
MANYTSGMMFSTRKGKEARASKAIARGVHVPTRYELKFKQVSKDTATFLSLRHKPSLRGMGIPTRWVTETPYWKNGSFANFDTPIVACASPIIIFLERGVSHVQHAVVESMVRAYESFKVPVLIWIAGASSTDVSEYVVIENDVSITKIKKGGKVVSPILPRVDASIFSFFVCTSTGFDDQGGFLKGKREENAVAMSRYDDYIIHRHLEMKRWQASICQEGRSRTLYLGYVSPRVSIPKGLRLLDSVMITKFMGLYTDTNAIEIPGIDYTHTAYFQRCIDASLRSLSCGVLGSGVHVALLNPLVICTTLSDHKDVDDEISEDEAFDSEDEWSDGLDYFAFG